MSQEAFNRLIQEPVQSFTYLTESPACLRYRVAITEQNITEVFGHPKLWLRGLVLMEA